MTNRGYVRLFAEFLATFVLITTVHCQSKYYDARQCLIGRGPKYDKSH